MLSTTNIFVCMFDKGIGDKVLSKLGQNFWNFFCPTGTGNPSIYLLIVLMSFWILEGLLQEYEKKRLVLYLKTIKYLTSIGVVYWQLSLVANHI